MDEGLEVKLARIEQNVKHIRHDLELIKNSLPNLSLEVALLKRDAKWRHTIVMVLGGCAGMLTNLLVEFFRR